MNTPPRQIAEVLARKLGIAGVGPKFGHCAYRKHHPVRLERRTFAELNTYQFQSTQSVTLSDLSAGAETNHGMNCGLYLMCMQPALQTCDSLSLSLSRWIYPGIPHDNKVSWQMFVLLDNLKQVSSWQKTTYYKLLLVKVKNVSISMVFWWHHLPICTIILMIVEGNLT